jgi:hypothetical protein
LGILPFKVSIFHLEALAECAHAQFLGSLLGRLQSCLLVSVETLQSVELPRNVEEVLDDGSHRDRRENEVQQRYPNHVDPYVIIVGIANLSVHMKCEPNESTVCKIIDLGEIPEVAVGTGWDLPGYRVLDCIVYGEEFDP